MEIWPTTSNQYISNNNGRQTSLANSVQLQYKEYSDMQKLCKDILNRFSIYSKYYFKPH